MFKVQRAIFQLYSGFEKLNNIAMHFLILCE